MVTKEAFQDPHKEVVGWENFLGMTIGQAVVWASQNIDPKHINPELTTSEPYVMGSHATCSAPGRAARRTMPRRSISGAITA
jgi:adenylylsulfate reductase subunit A